MLVDGSEDPRTYSKTHRRGLRRRVGVYHMAPCGSGTVGTSVGDGSVSRAPANFLFIDFIEGRQNTTPSRARSSDVTTEARKIAGVR